MYVKNILPTFSSKSFIATGLTIKSLIHLEFFFFLYDIRKCYIFII